MFRSILGSRRASGQRLGARSYFGTLFDPFWDHFGSNLGTPAVLGKKDWRMPAQHHLLDAFWENSGILEHLGAALEGILAPFLDPFWAPGGPLGSS